MRAPADASAPPSGQGLPELLHKLTEVAAEAQRARTVTGVLEAAGGGLWKIGLRLSVMRIRDGIATLDFCWDPDAALGWLERAIGRPLRGLSGPVQPGGF